MATSLPPVYLPAGQWVDLYDETSITVGTRLNVHNPFVDDVYLTESASEPDPLESTPSSRDIGVSILMQSQDRENQSNAVGAWAMCFRDTTIQVEEA